MVWITDAPTAIHGALHAQVPQILIALSVAIRQLTAQLPSTIRIWTRLPAIRHAPMDSIFNLSYLIYAFRAIPHA